MLSNASAESFHLWSRADCSTWNVPPYRQYNEFNNQQCWHIHPAYENSLIGFELRLPSFFFEIFLMTLHLRPFLFGVLVFSVGTHHSQAGIADFFKRSGEKKVLNAEQLSNQESSAQAQLAKAKAYEDSGKTKQARDSYKAVSRSFSRTDAGAGAKFDYARMLEETGEKRDAFEEYQELITNHRNTPNFSEAVRRQFAIAEALRTTDKKGFLGVGAPVQPSKLVEMFKQISDTAPFTEFAPKSLLNVGIVHQDNGETVEAIKAFQSVVDKYPDTEAAKDAQYQIFKLRGVKAEKSNSPVEDRAQVEAGLDFVNQNPEDQRASEIKSNLQSIEERSMEKMFSTGSFYEKSGKPESARVYYSEVVKNPSTPWAAKAQERLNAMDRAPASVEKKAGMFGPNPSKKGKMEMRTTGDEVVPLPTSGN